MAPRIRPLFAGPRLFARAAEPPKAARADAPQVFREFVAQLEKLDAPAETPTRRAPARRRAQTGNGHARPARRNRRRSK
jgi:hypothetical protein